MIGYVRCSTRDQAAEGNSLDVQRRKIAEAAESRGWTITHWVEDAGRSGKTMDRPGVKNALDLLEQKRADGLVVAKLDRLGRSVAGLSGVLAHATKHGWSLVALDMDIDTTTHTGRMVLHVLAALAEWERDRAAERTSEGMAYARDAYGHVPGRPRGTPEELASRIVRERMRGETLAAIARGLNSDGYFTTRGKDWRPGTVRMVLAQEGVL